MSAYPRTQQSVGFCLRANSIRYNLTISLASGRLCRRGRSQRDGGLVREQQESERLLQIQSDGGIGVAEITYGDILTDVKVEIAATGGQHKSTGNRGRPDDLIVDKPLDVLQHRVPVVAGLGECGVGVDTEQHRVGRLDHETSCFALMRSMLPQ